jgi:hypothetical protein
MWINDDDDDIIISTSYTFQDGISEVVLKVVAVNKLIINL